MVDLKFKVNLYQHHHPEQNKSRPILKPRSLDWPSQSFDNVEFFVS